MINNRIAGGKKGRDDGYAYQNTMILLIDKHNKLKETLNKFKYSDIDILSMEHARGEFAADSILVLNKKANIRTGIDYKKPDSASATQWCRMRILKFLNLIDATVSERELLYKYCAYNELKIRNNIMNNDEKIIL